MQLLIRGATAGAGRIPNCRDALRDHLDVRAQIGSRSRRSVAMSVASSSLRWVYAVCGLEGRKRLRVGEFSRSEGETLEAVV